MKLPNGYRIHRRIDLNKLPYVIYKEDKDIILFFEPNFHRLTKVDSSYIRTHDVFSTE